MFRMARLLPVLAVVALLSACTRPGLVTVETGVDIPAALRQDGLLGDSGPQAAWSGDDREAFVVVVYGSSSCAPSPVDLTLTNPLALAVEFGENTNDVCTADMAANTFRFESPEGVSATGAVELSMTFEQDGETTVEKISIVG